MYDHMRRPHSWGLQAVPALTVHSAVYCGLWHFLELSCHGDFNRSFHFCGHRKLNHVTVAKHFLAPAGPAIVEAWYRSLNAATIKIQSTLWEIIDTIEVFIFMK
jgi:hypothetical protein